MAGYVEHKITNKAGWFYIAIGSLCISIISLVFPIIVYTTEEGTRFFFTIVHILTDEENFHYYIIRKYKGDGFHYFTGSVASALAIIAIIALVGSFVGLITLRVQESNRRSFILTVVSLVGITIPSIYVINLIIFLQDCYTGTVGIGPAPVISPVAAICAIIVVFRRPKKDLISNNSNIHRASSLDL